MLGGLIHGAWSIAPDWRYTRYVLKWGPAKGPVPDTRHDQCPAQSRRHSARHQEVVLIPWVICRRQATEWVPILPGTDTAVGLAIANYILNTRGEIDELYLKAKTNFVYLIREDGTFIRDSDTDKPLVFDNKAKKIRCLMIRPSLLKIFLWKATMNTMEKNAGPALWH